MYDWVVTKDVQQVPDVVKSGASTGPEWGKIGAIPTPGQGYTGVSTSPTLKWTKVGSQPSNKVFFGTANPPPEVASVDGYSYSPGQLNGGTVYYWKINEGKIWKFRTEGTPVPVHLKPSPKTQKASLPSLRFQKYARDESGSYIGVEKIENGQKQNYNLLGAKTVNQKTRRVNKKD
jgi:hypothetical protein